MKRLLIALAWFCFLANGFAANEGFDRTAMEASAGFSFARLEPGANQTNRLGLTAGIGADIHLTGPLFFQAQALYMQKGALADAASLASLGATSYTIGVESIEVPLLLKTKFGIEALRVTLSAGPSFGFLIKRSATLVASGITTVTDLSSSYGTFDLSAVLAVGTEFATGPGSDFFVEARYYLGMNPINTGTTASAKTRAVVLLVGAHFTDL